MPASAPILHTNLEVSRICYGTNKFGTAIDQSLADDILDAFVALGGNFIDTARSYGDWDAQAPAGASERTLGNWLKRRNRSSMVIATKGCQFDRRAGDGRNRVTPKDLARDLSESLDHLGCDTIDLYWLHQDNLKCPVDVIVDALLSHQAEGRIRHFGASNWKPERIIEANAYAASLGKLGFVASQTFWGLALPDVNAATKQGYQLHYENGYQALHASGLPMIPYAAQSGGYFSKLAAGGDEALPAALKARYNNNANVARLAVAQKLAKRHDVPINHIVLAYLLCQPHQTIPIIGAGSPHQIEESFNAATVRLTEDELDELRVA